MKVIAFTGMPFSGKSEAVEIAKKQGIPVIRMGDLVWEEVKNRYLDLTGENVGKIAHEMRVKEGMDIWAKRTIQRINEMKKSSILVVDGVRNSEEITAFKQNFGSDFLLISIDASDEIRHKRGLIRKRIDDCVDKDEIQKRDEREITWGIRRVMVKADKTFRNEQTLSSFQQKIRKFFLSL